eukprot:3203293-Pyramimonas_sp.AAC.1
MLLFHRDRRLRKIERTTRAIRTRMSLRPRGRLPRSSLHGAMARCVGAQHRLGCELGPSRNLVGTE